MRLFGSKRGKPDWVCINVHADRVDVCHVQAAGRARPEILTCDSFRKEDGDTATLRRLNRELQLNRHRCTTLLKPGEYQISQIDAPGVPRAEAASAARWKIQEMIDYPVEGATVDAVFIPAAGGAEARNAQMLVVSARNEIIAATIKPFNEADIALEAIDIPDLAQRNFAQWLELPGRGLALLAFDERGGLLTFSSEGELFQSRRIDVSLKSFEGDAEARKGVYDRLVLELQRSLDHFDRQFRHVAVARVMVTPIAGAADMRDYLASNLDVPVALVHLSEIMDFPHIPELHEEARQAQCLQLIGATLREQAIAAVEAAA
jgi:MSHA biogenesis protein MshI